MIESLAGPGGGGTMDSSVGSVERDSKEIAKKGAGAFPHHNNNENPPVYGRKSPDAKYYQRRHMSKGMKKKMKKS